MKVDSFPKSWLNRLDLRIFAVNSRDQLLPNLWCLCSSALNPVGMDFDDQQVSFNIELDGRIFGLTDVYASTNFVKRREL
jgi:hypothetical protein